MKKLIISNLCRREMGCLSPLAFVESEKLFAKNIKRVGWRGVEILGVRLG